MYFASLGFFAAFLLGSIPTGYLLVKAKTGKDIRTLGSGNIGSTNVGRVLGGKWGYLVLFLDVLKGTLAYYVGISSVEGLDSLPGWDIALLTQLPLAAVAGHCFSPWIGFRGGKGVATMFGALIPPLGMMFGWGWALLPVLVHLFVSKVMKAVSLGSIAAAVAFFVAYMAPSFRFIPSGPVIAFIMSAGTVALVLWRHKENIKRLLAGTEPRMGDNGAAHES